MLSSKFVHLELLSLNDYSLSLWKTDSELRKHEYLIMSNIYHQGSVMGERRSHSGINDNGVKFNRFPSCENIYLTRNSTKCSHLLGSFQRLN